MRSNQMPPSQPLDTKRKICVCYGLTSDMEFAAGVSILNFVNLHGSEDFDFVIYSDSRLPKLVAALASRDINVRVVVFRPPVTWLELYSSRAVSYFSPLVLSKFEIFKQLGAYSRVIWLDFDIVIIKKLNVLYSDVDFDFGYVPSGMNIRSGFIEPPPMVNLETLEKDGLSAGLLIANNDFPGHTDVTDALYQGYREHAQNLYYPEQAILDLLLDKAPIKRLILDARIYCSDPDNQSEDTLILHSWGERKFWNGRENLIWSGYYDDWKSIGGRRYKPSLVILNGALRRIQHIAALVITRFRLGWNLGISSTSKQPKSQNGSKSDS